MAVIPDTTDPSAVQTPPHHITGFIVDAFDGTNGEPRAILDRAGEPEIFLTESSARDVAEAWAIHANAETRVRDLVTGEIVPSALELDDMADRLNVVDPRPELTDYAAWIAEGIEAAAETRAFERSRSALMRTIYGEAA